MEKDSTILAVNKDSQSDLYKKDSFVDVDVLGVETRALNADIIEAIAHARTMTDEEIIEIIEIIVEQHGTDPNFPPRVLEAARRYLYDEGLKNDLAEYRNVYEELKIEAALIAINSSYAEVRAVVDNHDDPNVPASTFRSWALGITFVIIGAFINQFFSIRLPGIGVGSSVVQILAYPAGKALESVLPTRQFTTFGYIWSLNPGPFNRKEHMIITIMANVGFSPPYSVNIVWVQYLGRFFNERWATNFGYQILLALSTNFIGYGLAGLTRRFIVYPSYAIWPSNLAVIALNRAFHDNNNTIVSGWKTSRIKYFGITFSCMFVYFWFPGFIFQALSYFNWMTWIAPDNVTLAAITGSISGLGFNPIGTFDWLQIAGGVDPLVNPFFSTANIVAGAFMTFPVVAAIWYTNTWYTGYLPINSNHVFDNTGSLYNVSMAVDANRMFNHTSYMAYSPAYLAAGNLVVYAVYFALYGATISHAIIYYRRVIARGFRTYFSHKTWSGSYEDVHSRLMKSYKEVPEWAYFAILVVSICLGAAGIGAYPTNTSPAVVLFGVFLAVIFCIPIGIMASTANVGIGLNVLAELLAGLWFPGNANAVNFFKSYGVITTIQTLSFAQDLKLAHYVHIAPRVTFSAQVIATLVSSFVCVGILNFQMTQINGVCSPTQVNHFTCPGVNTFFTASVLWGTIGPKRMFGSGALYNGILYAFLIGAALPILFYLLRKKCKTFEYVHIPALLTGGLIWAPYNLQYIWPALPVGWLFNVYIKRRYLPWWSKFNYITSGAFSSSIALSAIVIFFALQWQSLSINWVGNNRPFEGCDAAACPRLNIPAEGYFGPGVGEFS